MSIFCLCGVVSITSKQMDMQAMMDTYTKLATPGEPHKQFASLVGSWTTKTKSWMEPNKPPTESTGSCEQKMLLDGRFLQQECTGDMMEQPFTGIGVIGYDNHTKKYISTWTDSIGTGIYAMEGTASADSKTITQKGSYNDPIEGPMKLRGVTKMMDKNTETAHGAQPRSAGVEANRVKKPPGLTRRWNRP